MSRVPTDVCVCVCVEIATGHAIPGMLRHRLLCEFVMTVIYSEQSVHAAPRSPAILFRIPACVVYLYPCTTLHRCSVLVADTEELGVVARRAAAVANASKRGPHTYTLDGQSVRECSGTGLQTVRSSRRKDVDFVYTPHRLQYPPFQRPSQSVRVSDTIQSTAA